MKDFEALLVAFEKFVDARIAIALGDRDNKSAIYSTAPGGKHPGKRRWFVERCRKHPKARRIGGKRGRGVQWEIDALDFDTSHAVTVTSRETKAAKTAVDITSLLAANGYRPARKAG